METLIDKSKELRTKATLINEKLHFEGIVSGNKPVSIDYTPPLGDNLGYTSLELLLLSLSTCAGSAMLVILRRMNKQIDFFEINSSGYRKSEHPTGFKSISMNVTLRSPNVTHEDLVKVNKLIEGLCPVLSMMNTSVEVRFEYRIIE